MRYPQFRLGWSRVHATLFGLALGSVAFAQTASQITPPTSVPAFLVSKARSCSQATLAWPRRRELTGFS